MKFDDFGLHPKLLEGVKAMGFETPSPIQEQSIPLLMQGEDLIGQAQTGTGKTAAFGLPMLDRFLHMPPEQRPQPQAGVAKPFGLVMCPTRELAIQVCEQMEKMAHLAKINVVPVYGGQEMEKQMKRFQSQVDIVVGTPGRIMDHMERGTLKLENVQVAVLDEADRMLDMGFVEDVVGILRHTTASRQTSLFSATMPREVLNIAYEFMKSPQSVTVTPEQLAVEKIGQHYVVVDALTRMRALKGVLHTRHAGLTLIFCRTKRGADRVGLILRETGFKAKALHGDLTQKQRDEAMGQFREGKLQILVATDLASRGLDVFDISHVINYDLPEDHLTYVHRIGRTGRMGAEGEAISLIFPDQTSVMDEWSKQIGAKINPLKIEGLPEPRQMAPMGSDGSMQTAAAAAPVSYGRGSHKLGGMQNEPAAHTHHAGVSRGFGAGGPGGSGHGFGGSAGGAGHERRAFGSSFGHDSGSRGPGGSREGGHAGSRTGSRQFGGEGRSGGERGSGFGGRREGGSGGRGREGGFGGREGGSGFGRSSDAPMGGRTPISPMTLKKIRERPLKPSKPEGVSRGHHYVGRQN